MNDIHTAHVMQDLIAATVEGVDTLGVVSLAGGHYGVAVDLWDEHDPAACHAYVVAWSPDPDEGGWSIWIAATYEGGDEPDRDGLDSDPMAAITALKELHDAR